MKKRHKITHLIDPRPMDRISYNLAKNCLPKCANFALRSELNYVELHDGRHFAPVIHESR
jgi:hypothetical protein